MPYKRDGSDAPEAVRKLTAKKRRQWVAIFNSAFAKCTTDGGSEGDCEGAAFAQANGVVLEVEMPEEVTKTVGGEQFPASDFLVVEDPQAPSTWHLQVKKNGVPDRALAGAAWAALFNPSGHRGNPYAGPEKGAAQEKLRALYNSEEWDMPKTESVKEMDVSGVLELLKSAMDALKAMGAPPDEDPMPEEPPEDEMPVDQSETFAESAVPVQIAEETAPTNRRAPLALDVGLIRVGPGNKRDNNYYTREMLERDGGVFKGVKMYATDHRNDEKSVRTEVSLVSEVMGVKELADGGEYLMGRATVFNPDFAEDVRNRADAGVLDSLHCSILAKGEAKPGKVGEQDYNIVQAITEAQGVDWVTRAGAGGHALQLAESEPEPEAQPVEAEEVETQTVTLSEREEVIQPLALAEVIAELGNTNLPAQSVAKLAGVEYHELSEVQSAVAEEVARLKAAGSGQPLGQPRPQERKTLSRLEIKEQQAAVNRKYMGGR